MSFHVLFIDISFIHFRRLKITAFSFVVATACTLSLVRQLEASIYLFIYLFQLEVMLVASYIMQQLFVMTQMLVEVSILQ
jgi:hypothetical protein